MPENSNTAKQEIRKVLLSEDQYRQIASELDILRAKLKAQLILFGDLNGQLICEKGEIPGADTTILTALLAGDFSATTEIAKIIGHNNHFRLHYHEGSLRHLYVSSLSDQFFLAVTFDATVTLGMVRIFTRRTIDKVSRIIETDFEEMVKISNIINSEFKTYVTEGLDKILG